MKSLNLNELTVEQKIGQLICRPVIYVDYVDALGEERKDGAFGSTDKIH